MKSRKRIYKKRKGTKRRCRGGGILKYGKNNNNNNKTKQNIQKISFEPISSARVFNNSEFTDTYIPTKNPNDNNSLNKINLLAPAPYPHEITKKLEANFDKKRRENPTNYWGINQWCMYYIKLLDRIKQPDFTVTPEDDKIYDKINKYRSYQEEYPCAKKIFNIINKHRFSKAQVF